MKARASILATLGLLASLALAASSQAATPAPAWAIQSLASPTNFKPGDESGLDRYQVSVTNSGGEQTDGATPIEIVDTLPAGLAVSKVELRGPRGNVTLPACSTEEAGASATVSCEVSEALLPEAKPALLYPGNQLILEIQVKTPPPASGTLFNRIEVEGGGAPTASYEASNRASSEEATAGFQEFRAELLGADGLPAHQAASHPYAFVTSFGVNTVAGEPGGPAKFLPASGDLKEVEVALPPGLAANPTAVERCKAQDFITVVGAVSKLGVSVAPNECPPGSAVGLAAVQQLEGERITALLPVYNLVPPKGMPAQLGFEVFGLPTYINTRLRSEGDYGATAYVANTTEAKRITAARITIWGAPWEESHDTLRAQCAELETSCEAPGPARAFMRTPSQCTDPLGTRMSFTTWAQPITGAAASFGEAAPGGCAAVPFAPAIEARPSTAGADSPAGFDFKLDLPQRGGEEPEALGEADLREARVKLPEGLVVNPSSADGRQACTPSQVGLTTPAGTTPAHFDLAPESCPDASKLGTVEADVPALDHTVKGAAYLATPYQNPFGTLLAFYIVLEDEQSGIVVKLPARVSLDQSTGQVTTSVPDSPQVPFEEFRFHFFEGPRAPLRTPATCGAHTTTTQMTPWSAPAGVEAHPSDSFQTTGPAAGQSSCPTSASGEPNSPGLQAGTEAPLAGAYSPLIVNLSRGDGSQEFGRLTLTPPPGLLASLRGIPYCPDSALASASSRSGRDEESSPSCPGASQVGTATVGAGAGPAPYHVTGRAYLAGPYEGAPLSLAVLTPAVAGPFDLGTVVVRSALHVDPVSAQITATTDEIPHILDGIPLDVRTISVKLDHPGWGLNPTSCEPSSFAGSLRSVLGSEAALSNRFQVGECARLGFKPHLKLRLRGKTRRTGFPALRAVYVPKPGDANLKRMVLRFPRSEFIEQGHFRTICTRVQWAAGAGGGTSCPKGSIYGHIRATTPLLDTPLEGPVYLRSSNHNLPDVVFALRGQVNAEVAVRIDSKKGGLRASIENAPDVPIARVVLNMRGGQKGLFVNSRDICAHRYRAAVRLGAHNGKTGRLKPPMRAKCPKRHRHRRHGHRHGHGHRGGPHRGGRR